MPSGLSKHHFICEPGSTKPVLSRWGIFVAIANNALYGSKLSYIIHFLLLICQTCIFY